MKNSNDTIGNRTRDLPACSAVPQPTAPPRAPEISKMTFKKSFQSMFLDALLRIYMKSERKYERLRSKCVSQISLTL